MPVGLSILMHSSPSQCSRTLFYEISHSRNDSGRRHPSCMHTTSAGMAKYTIMWKAKIHGALLRVPTSTDVTHKKTPPNLDACENCFFPSPPTRFSSRQHSFAEIDASTAGVCCQYIPPACLRCWKIITLLTCLATFSHTPLQHESRKNPADRSKDTIILQKEKSCMTSSKIQSKSQSTR